MKTVLIVDDQEVFRECLAEGLDRYCRGIHILSAGNGAEALMLLETVPVDLVLTDIKMPVMDGFELLSHMQQSFPDVPVIAMSAFFNKNDGSRLTDLGVLQYLEKPLDVQALGNLISHTI